MIELLARSTRPAQQVACRLQHAGRQPANSIGDVLVWPRGCRECHHSRPDPLRDEPMRRERSAIPRTRRRGGDRYLAAGFGGCDAGMHGQSQPVETVPARWHRDAVFDIQLPIEDGTGTGRESAMRERGRCAQGPAVRAGRWQSPCRQSRRERTVPSLPRCVHRRQGRAARSGRSPITQEPSRGIPRSPSMRWRISIILSHLPQGNGAHACRDRSGHHAFVGECLD